MPHLHLSYAPAGARSPEAAALAQTLTKLTAEHLHKVPELTAVEVQLQAPQQWFIGGRSLADHGLGSFKLRIEVTQGTNTPEQASAYIQAVFEAMQAALGPLHEASYVVVQEVPGALWGYGGRTQAARKAASPTPS